MFLHESVSLTFILHAVNKRLDEWVTAERLDNTKIQYPKKDTKSNKRNCDSVHNSPDREIVVSRVELLLTTVLENCPVAHGKYCILSVKASPCLWNQTIDAFSSILMLGSSTTQNWIMSGSFQLANIQ